MSRTAAAILRGLAPALAQEAEPQQQPQPEIFAETSVGQVIEYVPERLYLACYLHPPNENTLFPYPEPPAPKLAAKRSNRTLAPKPAPRRIVPFYFTVDDYLPYNAFHHDFGPLHIGHLYRFALEFHEILSCDDIPVDRPIVFWSRPDPRSRANAACILACYMILVQNWAPHLALAPIAQADPPFMPFRDAGYSQADYGITIQDVVYGVWKAKEQGVCTLNGFDLADYEKHERVENGDFNWISPHFLALASPQFAPVERVRDAKKFAQLPKTVEEVNKTEAMPGPLKSVLTHFKERGVGLVVRLNSELYSPSYFEALGIKHLDMIFEDGTCPNMHLVRRFIRIANEMIVVRRKGIAVHCKAGLGRTGCLIGAYLIYRYGFTADEVISYMRFMRPGMVVGPQQHWLHIHQGQFREWWVEERVERRIRDKLAARTAAKAEQAAPSTPVRAMQSASLSTTSKTGAATPPHRSTSNRTPLGEMGPDCNGVTIMAGGGGAQEDYLPAPTPGQPRKTARVIASPDRHHTYQRGSEDSGSHASSVQGEARETEMMSVRCRSHGAETNEEWHVRVPVHGKASAQPSRERTSSSSFKSSRCSSRTTTTKVYQALSNDASNDIENIGAGNPKTSKRTNSGVTVKVRSAGQPAGIRKVSGRVGSVGGASAAASSAVRRLSGQSMV